MSPKPAKAGSTQVYVVRNVVVSARTDTDSLMAYPVVTSTTCAAMRTTTAGPRRRW